MALRMLVAMVVGARLLALPVLAQQNSLPATDVLAKDINAFIAALPADAVSDRAIRVVDAGTHRIGVFAVRRPAHLAGDAILHDVPHSEVYYMLTGAGTLVTGGTLVDRNRRDSDGPGTFRGSRIEGGVTRRIGPGDVVVIPPGTPHWWSSLEGEVTYVIFRPDPLKQLPLR